MVLADTLLPNNNQLHQLQQRSNSFISTSSSSNGNNNICHQQQQDGIHINNLSEGETLSYSLALVRGKAPLGCTYIRVRGCIHRNQVSEWPVVNGDFRLLIELQRGPNKLELEAGGFKRKLSLIYEPRPTRLRVTPVYVICAGHDGYFQGPRSENRSPESAATRIGLGARLLQSLTAEKLHEAGHGRKTFQLERDLDGPECLVMHSVLHVDRARAISQRELWDLIGRELMTGPLASKDRKYLAFLSCTRYRGAPSPRTHEDTLARTQGHAALGGGGLALFGSACLHTWPTCMSEAREVQRKLRISRQSCRKIAHLGRRIRKSSDNMFINLGFASDDNYVLERFLDTTAIDTEQLMDDSNYRGTHGGCLATTLGSVLHELGHTFDLGHTRDGIMGRGFDYVDRVFLGAAGIDSNRNSTARREPQHTTIALSRPLSVTVTVQQPPRQVNSRRGRLLSETSRPRSATFGPSGTPGRLSAPASPELNRSFAKSIVAAAGETPAQTDRTFWGASCAALLAHHRWFNSDMDNVKNRNHAGDLKYDAKRNIVRSRYGVRIIELRELVGGMVVSSRQFPGNHLTLEAMVPAPPPHCIAALTLIAEDSVGCILKHPLPTSF